jgi:hypothetical protein
MNAIAQKQQLLGFIEIGRMGSQSLKREKIYPEEGI